MDNEVIFVVGGNGKPLFGFYNTKDVVIDYTDLILWSSFDTNIEVFESLIRYLEINNQIFMAITSIYQLNKRDKEIVFNEINRLKGERGEDW